MDASGYVQINIHGWWINLCGYGWYPWIIHIIHETDKWTFCQKVVVICAVDV
jgi:hypothetical protein